MVDAMITARVDPRTAVPSVQTIDGLSHAMPSSVFAIFGAYIWNGIGWQGRCAKFLGVRPATISAWANAASPVPAPVVVLIVTLMQSGDRVTIHTIVDTVETILKS